MPDRQALTTAYAELLEHTETITEAAARRGISHGSMRKKVERGEIEHIMVGRNIRIWR
jgi:excisionase family DNA binding protein